MAHADRAHAAWSASASDRRWACPGSLAAETTAPPDTESHAAAWGTAAHEVSEECLRSGRNAVSFVGETISTKEHQIAVDEDLAECAQVYVDYVRSRGKEMRRGRVVLEQKFSLASINPPLEAGGTADCVLLNPDAGEMEVVDLKTGYGIVDVTGNKQLRTYALGAVIANPGPYRRIKMTIVQPRAPHRDGPIRSETIDVIDLVDWAAELLAAMHAAVQPDAPLVAGGHCTFCRARPVCPALREQALAAAHVHFTDLDAVSVPPDPATLKIDQLVKILDAADMIEGWLKAVRMHAHRLAEGGAEITDGESNWILVEGRAGNRAWTAEEADLVPLLAERTGLPPDDFYQEPKVLTPTQAEKMLGKDGYAKVADLVTRPAGKVSLAKASTTSRRAVPPPADKFFNTIPEE